MPDIPGESGASSGVSSEKTDAKAPDISPARGRKGKSAQAFSTISEVAEALNVPQHVLRFWETRFPQIRPLKRGGGRRYYRPEDVALLREIRSLLYSDGYTIKGVQKLLRQGRGARSRSVGSSTDTSKTNTSMEEAEAGALAPQPDVRSDSAAGDGPDTPDRNASGHQADRLLIREAIDELTRLKRLLHEARSRPHG